MAAQSNYPNKFLQFQGEKKLTFCFLGDAQTKYIFKPMTSHLDVLVRPTVYSPVSPKCPHKVKHPRVWGGAIIRADLGPLCKHLAQSRGTELSLLS